ncbi:MAG: hypothetical protein RL701_3957 [Pseudomonadota bacterium]|jgi:AcrR family transcriptional regulator
MLSAQAVVNAGVEAVREHGLDALSVRALAERLSVTPMALYRHVASAEALSLGVVEAVLLQVPAVESTGTWEARANAWAHAARTVLAEHPGVARFVLTHWFGSAAALDHVEALLTAAETAELRGFAGVAAVNAVFTFVLMRVEAEQAIRGAGVIKRQLASDPKGERGRWPRLKANRSEYTVARLDLHFDYGLDALLTGIRSHKQHEHT